MHEEKYNRRVCCRLLTVISLVLSHSDPAQTSYPLEFVFKCLLWVPVSIIPIISAMCFVLIDMAALTINEHEGDGDQDTLGPLPTHQAISWIAGPPSYGYHQMPSYPGPPPQAIVDTQTPGYAQSFYSAHSGSQSPHSASGSSRKSGGGGDRADGDHRSSGGSSSEKSSSSKGKSKEREARSVEGSPQLVQGPPPVGVPMPGGPPMPGIAMMPRPLDQVPENISASRNSFRMAMGNPCEFFVDVM